MDVGGYGKELKLEWYLKFKDWYNNKYPIQTQPEEEKSDDGWHDIRKGLSFTSSSMSQEEQLQQEEEKPKEMIVARNTIAA